VNDKVRILGIDYGDRRVGLAVSDDLGLAAHGLGTLENTSPAQVVEEVRRIVESREIQEIVVGLPRNMDGSLGPQARKVMQFAEQLKVLGRPVHLVDERLTTERARRVMRDAGLSRSKQRRRLDRMAAQFILQPYLDARRRNSTRPDA